VTEIHALDDGNRRWAPIDRGTARPAEGPGTGGGAAHRESHPILGSGVLQADIVRAIAEIEVPPKEEIAKSVAFVSDRISSEAGAGLAAQANVVPPRALALLTDER
jgi:hypothetical protein